jgi:glycosyltransferase involved in cell wall biosynthesis
MRGRLEGTRPPSAILRLKPVLLYLVNEDWAFVSHRLPMARAARDAGFDVHVATNVNAKADAIRAEGFTLHAIPFRRGGLSPTAALRTIWAVRRLERTLSPSLIHHSGLQSCVLGAIAALGTATPQVNALTGMGFLFTSSSPIARLLKPLVAKALGFLFGRKRSVALVQNPDDRQALLAMGISEQQIALIPGSGVDTDALQPLPEPDGPITVGFAGRLLFDKGILALVAAHRLLRKQGLDIQLLIAGEPDPANPASVSRAEAEAWRKEPGITWLGHVGDIVSLWRRSHIAALPSHREGLPKSLLEAAACGRPMVATDAPGCREICINEQTGLLVPIENPTLLAKAIAALAGSPDLRARYGAAARQLVVDKMSDKAVGEATVALYRSVMNSAIAGRT